MARCLMMTMALALALALVPATTRMYIRLRVFSKRAWTTAKVGCCCRSPAYSGGYIITS